MKSLFRKLAAGALALSLSLTAASAALTPIRDFGGSGFLDVPDDWSYPYIRSCYELGLLSGQGDGLFAPSGTLSLAEAITVAARVHSLWRGGSGELPAGTPWYTGAVDYATSHGLLSQGDDSDYTAPATRAQVAGLLAKALPSEDLAPINQIAALPDVTSDTPYADSIFLLYCAGVLTGSDVYGTFSPDASISRAELAAILCRLVQPESRQHLQLWGPGQTEGPTADQDIVSLDAASLEAAVSGGSLTAVFFSASWCQPCQLLTPTIGQLATQYQGRVLVGRVKVDEDFSLAERYGVSAFPSVIFFQGGQEFDRQVGIKDLATYTAILDSRL